MDHVLLWWGKYLWGKGHLDAALQDVVSGDLHRAGQLQVLQNQMVGHLWEHLLDLMSLGGQLMIDHTLRERS